MSRRRHHSLYPQPFCPIRARSPPPACAAILCAAVDGTWHPVAPREGCIIVNGGDQIDALTNGHYRSARHRVVSASSAPRFSAAFFAYFNYRAKLAPLPQYVGPSHPCSYSSNRDRLDSHFSTSQVLENLAM